MVHLPIEADSRARCRHPGGGFASKKGTSRQSDAAFWKKEAFDVVFFRNVVMYFTPEQARGILSRVAASLTPGGLLFLGHAETLRGISQDFHHLRHTHDTFYYQRREDLEGGSPTETWDHAPAATAGTRRAGRRRDVLGRRDPSFGVNRVRSLTRLPGRGPRRR